MKLGRWVYDILLIGFAFFIVLVMFSNFVIFNVNKIYKIVGY